jgi:hypothetical protein
MPCITSTTNLIRIIEVRMKTQSQNVLDHMKKYGSISSLEAEKEYGITRLIHCIIRLRSQGHHITEEMRIREDRWGKTYHVKTYVMNSSNERN